MRLTRDAERARPLWYSQGFVLQQDWRPDPDPAWLAHRPQAPVRAQHPPGCPCVKVPWPELPMCRSPVTRVPFRRRSRAGLTPAALLLCHLPPFPRCAALPRCHLVPPSLPGGLCLLHLGCTCGCACRDLEDNALTGKLPTELGKLSLLEKLCVMRAAVCAMSCMGTLSGTLPPTVLPRLLTRSFRRRDCARLCSILKKNSLTGPIPSELGKLTALLEL